MNYVDTFITVADDCPVATGVVPHPRGGRKTVAVIQYEMLTARPYTLTQEDVLFETFVRQQGISAAELAERGAALRAEFFARPRACLRASPLPKRHGFGLHFDSEGKVALWPRESGAYARFAAGEGVTTVLKAMRSSRR